MQRTGFAESALHLVESPEVGVRPVAETTGKQDVNRIGQMLRFLMLNDDLTVSKLIGQMLDFHFVCEFEPVGRSETAIQRLLDGEYDLILLDSRLPEVVYAHLPAAIADVFHALTSHRPYRSPMSYQAACDYLTEHSDAHVDAEMVRCWTTVIMTACSSLN